MRPLNRMDALLTVSSAAALAVLAILIVPNVALADCMMPPPVDNAVQTADILFVGTVTATANRNSWATVQVEEVWRGPDQPSTLLIKGGPGGNAATSVDRSFEVGTKYLFFPYVDPQAGLSDNSCTSTQPWNEGLAPFRPADARAPTGGTSEGTGFDLGGIIGPLAVALVVAGFLFVAGFLARGRTT
jgi:hypothetical protein